jgi:hypothetical protein
MAKKKPKKKQSRRAPLCEKPTPSKANTGELQLGGVSFVEVVKTYKSLISTLETLGDFDTTGEICLYYARNAILGDTTTLQSSLKELKKIKRLWITLTSIPINRKRELAQRNFIKK